MFVYSYYKFLKYHVDFSVLFLNVFSAFSSLFFSHRSLYLRK